MSFLNELKRRNVLSDSLVIEDEIELTDEEDVSLGALDSNNFGK